MKAHSYLILLLTGLLGSCKPVSPTLQLENAWVIRHIQVISPERDSLLRNATVVVQGDSILYVGSSEVSLRGNYQSIEGKDKYLIPGLIDGHVHLTSVNGMDFQQQSQYPQFVESYFEQLPKSYLYFGFTTLIDLTSVDPERMIQLQSLSLRPDIYGVGSPAVIANGYPMHYAPPEHRFELFPNFLYLPGEAKNIPAPYKADAHSPRAVVERIKASGAIAVKTFYETGFDQRGLPVPSPELLAELKEEAHRQHLLLIAHGNSLQAHRALTEAGVDIIAHGLWNWDQFYENDSIPAEIKQLLDQESQKGVGYMPTLRVIEGLKALVEPNFLRDPQLRHVLPDSLLAWYKSPAGQAFARSMLANSTPEQMAKVYTRVGSQGRLALRYLNQRNGRILFASDTPSAPTYGNPPGYNGYLEIRQMQAAGIPLKKILQSATIENAKAFRLDQQYGTIEAGKVANLLILEKNPLLDITAYDAIHTIILRGKPIPRKILSALQP
jgi:imidazolonepropionase-like amidohydrolase